MDVSLSVRLITETMVLYWFRFQKVWVLFGSVCHLKLVHMV